MPTNLQSNPYNRTNWIDEIVDPTLPLDDPNRVVQKGTRFTASRANNIENGIFNAYQWLVQYYEEINRMRAEIEMIGRAPVNNGSFLDVLDGVNERNLVSLNESAVSQSALSVGATSITVDVTPFQVGTFVTVYDDVNSEDVKITAVDGKILTVSALKKAYKKGAKVAHSNAYIANEKLAHGSWGTYAVSMTEVV